MSIAVLIIKYVVLLGVVGMCINRINEFICSDLMIIMWVKSINVNFSFLKWFGLMNDAYIYRYTH